MYLDVAKGWAKLIGSNAAASLLQIGTLAIAARALEIEALGMLILVQTWVRVVDGLLNFQSVNVLTRFLSEAEESGRDEWFAGLIKAGLIIDLATAVLAMGVSIVGLFLVGSYFGLADEWLVAAIVYSLVIPTRLFGAAEAALRCMGRFWMIGGRSTFHALLVFCGTVSVWLLGGDVVDLLGVWIAGEIVANLCFLGMTWSVLTHSSYDIARSDARGAVAMSPNFWSQLWQTNASLGVRMLTQDGDVLIAGGLLGPAAASLLRAAKALSGALGQLGWPLRQVVSAPLSRFASQRDFRSLRRMAMGVSVVGMVAGIIATAGFALFSESIMRMVFGTEFVLAAFVAILLFGARTLFLSGVPLMPVMLAIDLSGRFLGAVIAGTVAFAVVAALALGPLGLVGLALGHIAFEVVWLGYGWIATLRELRKRESQFSPVQGPV
ncbi:hypothetical protein [Qipengyuania sp. JC766]|uniref:lipopolysaccharide biosynthesis protein n=1 Tax=Qipengyuania sp. JC766 TaxID=3232139 RepID=UPI0034589B5F